MAQPGFTRITNPAAPQSGVVDAGHRCDSGHPLWLGGRHPLRKGNHRKCGTDGCRPREIVRLVGESGSGKSTLGKTMQGFQNKTAGEAVHKGETLR